MAQRGRPATGGQTGRIGPDVLMAAKGQARAPKKALGAWLEEAIWEKIKRQGSQNE